MAVKLSNRITSPGARLWPDPKVIVTAVDPFVVVKAFVSDVVDPIGCMS